MAFPTGYTKYQNITIDHTKVAADLTDYIAYVNLADLVKAGADIFDTCRTDGGDLRATKSDGSTELAIEIVAIDTTAKTGEVHIKFSGTLSSSTDTVIRLYYNGTDTLPAVTATYGRNAVWTGYTAVYHGDGTTDSTGNGYTLTNNNSVPYNTGKIGKSFDGGTSNTNKTMSINSTFGMLGSTARTFSFWSKVNTTPGTAVSWLFFRHLFAGSAVGNYANVGYRDSAGTKEITMPTSPAGLYTTYTLTTGTWYHQRVTIPASNAGNITLFTNAASVGTTANWAQNYALTTRLALMADHALTSVSDVSVDEFRLQSGNQADNWTTTEYNNQNSASTFYAAGDEQGAGSASASPSASASSSPSASVSSSPSASSSPSSSPSPSVSSSPSPSVSASVSSSPSASSSPSHSPSSSPSPSASSSYSASPSLSPSSSPSASSSPSPSPSASTSSSPSPSVSSSPSPSVSSSSSSSASSSPSASASPSSSPSVASSVSSSPSPSVSSSVSSSPSASSSPSPSVSSSPSPSPSPSVSSSPSPSASSSPSPSVSSSPSASSSPSSSPSSSVSSSASSSPSSSVSSSPSPSVSVSPSASPSSSDSPSSSLSSSPSASVSSSVSSSPSPSPSPFIWIPVKRNSY